MYLHIPIGTPVITPEGPGVIKDYEIHEERTRPYIRYGVLHNIYPSNFPRNMYVDDILYYTPDELVRCD